MQATLINDWYITTDTGGSMGTTDTSGITAKQIHNATKVYNYLSNLGWSLSAIAGVLGNMQVESWLSPGLIQGTHRSQLPNSAADLSDVPNSVMINFYGNSGYGVGLVQWDGYTSTAPAGQKLVSFAERYGLNWYEGDTQMFRIEREQATNIQWSGATVNGTYWTWANFPTNTETPEVSAKIWRICYEVAASGTDARRQANARYWYDYFEGVQPPTDDWISGSTFAGYALSYNGQYLPYSQYDCIGFVNLVWRDIAVVANNNYNLPSGTNTLWRENTPQYPNLVKTYNTTSPDNQNPTPVLWYKDTISNCISQFGEIPTGALLFHQIGDDDNPQIPSQYRGDGIGNFVHVGIYVGNGQVMQSGGRDSGNIPGGGVHLSSYDSSAWNYVAFVCYVDCTGGSPEPPGPTPPTFDRKILLYARKKVNNYGKNRKLIYTMWL